MNGQAQSRGSRPWSAATADGPCGAVDGWMPEEDERLRWFARRSAQRSVMRAGGVPNASSV